MSRDQRTRLNNMIAERAPGAAITPGKGTLTEELDDSEREAEQPEQHDEAPAPAVKDHRRSVFDPPVSNSAAPDVEPTPSDDE